MEGKERKRKKQTVFTTGIRAETGEGEGIVEEKRVNHPHTQVNYPRSHRNVINNNHSSGSKKKKTTRLMYLAHRESHS